MKLKKWMMFVLVFALIGVLAACSSDSADGDGGKDKPVVIIGSKDNTENQLMGEMYAQILEDEGIKVKRNLFLGGTNPTYEALKKGDLSIYPEYTGTALTVMFQQPVERDQEKVLKYVREEFKKIGLEYLDPAAQNSTYSFAMKKDLANKLGIETYADLADNSKDLILSFPQEFDLREDGLIGLKKLYADRGNFEFKKQFQIDYNLRYQPLLNDESDVTVVIGTDGQISGYDLKLLEDETAFFPVYNVAPLMRSDILEAYPEIANRLNELAPFLTDEAVQEMNWKIDGDEKQEVEDVAREFLEKNKLLKNKK